MESSLLSGYTSQVTKKEMKKKEEKNKRMHRVCKECPLKFKAIFRAHRFSFLLLIDRHWWTPDEEVIIHWWTGW